MTKVQRERESSGIAVERKFLEIVSPSAPFGGAQILHVTERLWLICTDTRQFLHFFSHSYYVFAIECACVRFSSPYGV
jgi:hypothetical protein